VPAPFSAAKLLRYFGVDFDYNDDEMAEGFLTRIKRLWAAYKDVAAVRDLLQWLGWWKTALGIVGAGAAWLWAYARHLSGYRQFELARVVFTCVVLLINGLLALRERKRPTAPKASEPEPIHIAAERPVQPGQPRRLVVEVEHCRAEECSYEPTRELCDAGAITIGKTHRGCPLIRRK
jgi:hypothetical protein